MYGASRTATILGGKAVLGVAINSDYDLEKLVVRGLPYKTVDRLIERIYPDDRSRRWQIIPSSTYYRRRKAGHLTTEESSKVERIARVYGMMLDVWDGEGEEDSARCFMQTKHRLLDNRSPFQACSSELGARQVEDILGRIEYGVFS